MIRMAISVEGDTEQEFCDKILRPYFYGNHDAYIIAVNMGGDINLRKIKKEVRDLLYSYELVSTLYDFYGFKGKGKATKFDLENNLQNHFKQEKFIPYIQEHEFEALLFSDIEKIAREFLNLGKNRNKKINELSKIIKTTENKDPEKINGNRSTAPSKILKKCFSNYDKAFHGPAICEDIGLLKIRQECRGFNGWIEKLEQACSKLS